MNSKQKKYYQKSRIPSKFLENIIIIDANTAQFTTIAFLALLFIAITCGIYSGMTFEEILNFKPTKQTVKVDSEKKIKGNSVPFEIALIEAPEKQTIAEIKDKAQSESSQASDDIKSQFNIPKYEVPLIAKQKPKIKKTEKDEKNEPIENLLKPNKTGNIETSKIQINTTSKDGFSIQSQSSSIESDETKKYTKKLDAQVLDKITLYKPYITDKWKYVQSSYIITLDITEGQKPVINFVTKSANFYFNIIVERTFNNLECPSLIPYDLKEYRRTYVITYKP